MTLHIDSTQREILLVQLIKDDQVIAEQRSEQSTNHAQRLLPLIDQILKEQQLMLQNLTEISVNPGPGSFTGTRVGVAVAKGLGWALGLPVNGQPAETVLPVYDRAPNISQPKAPK